MSRTKFVIVHRAIYNPYFSELQDLLVRMNHESSKNNVNIDSSAAISFVRHFLLDSKSQHVVAPLSVDFHFQLSGSEASCQKSIESRHKWVCCASALP